MFNSRTQLVDRSVVLHGSLYQLGIHPLLGIISSRGPQFSVTWRTAEYALNLQAEKGHALVMISPLGSDPISLRVPTISATAALFSASAAGKKKGHFSLSATPH